MIKKLLAPAAVLFCLTFLAGHALAQPLPKVELRRAFPAYTPQLPLWISEAPDGSGRMFLVEQIGRILIMPKGGDGAQRQEFLNIVARKPHEDAKADHLAEGLLSMAFHPGFQTNGLFYICYHQQDPRRIVISEMKVSADDTNRADVSSERILLEVQEPFSNNQGGEVAFGPDGYLYIDVGDGGSGGDPQGNGQNTSALLAKMLRVDVNKRGNAGSGRNRKALAYGIPADNPFADEPNYANGGARKEIWAYGLRNVWRFSFDRQTGELWGGDVGQDLWEEVDILVKGGNYGWPVREGAHHFKPGPVGAQYVEPIMEYPHRANLLPKSLFPDHTVGACVIGGYVYRGKKYPSLRGVYIYGDNTVGTIWGLRYQNGKVTESGTLLAQPKNISSFAEDADGELYVLTLDPNAGDGVIYSLAVPD